MTECKHGLDLDTCSICLHPKPIPTRDAEPGKPRFQRNKRWQPDKTTVVLQARYATECLSCGEQIHPGDAIVSVGGVWVHEACG